MEEPIVKESELKEAGIPPEAKLVPLTEEELVELRQLGSQSSQPPVTIRVSKHTGSNNHGQSVPKKKVKMAKHQRRVNRRRK